MQEYIKWRGNEDIKREVVVTELEKLGEVIETDVLIVGGGISGLWAGVRVS